MHLWIFLDSLFCLVGLFFHPYAITCMFAFEFRKTTFSHCPAPNARGWSLCCKCIFSGLDTFRTFSIFIIALLVLRAVALVVMKSLLDARSSLPPAHFFYDYY